MKNRDAMSFIVKQPKQRNHVARAMFDRRGPYGERVENPKRAYERRAKNARQWNDWTE